MERVISQGTVMRQLISAMLIVVGVVHLLPVTGVLGASQLRSLYGIPIEDANLEILMRHRAVLFGLLGVFMVYSAFTPSLQRAALLAGFASVLSFLFLAGSIGGYNAAIARVVTVDVVALACLVVAAVAYWRSYGLGGTP